MRRFLTPREHGTYAQLAFPILSGLVLGRPGLAAFALAGGVIALYLAYEPAAVLLGMRGVRLQRAEAGVARGQLAVLVPLALLLAGSALVLLPTHVRLLVLVPAGTGSLLVPLLLSRRVKSLAGETVVAASLAGVHVPLAAAGGVTGVMRWGPAVVWFAGFFLATLAVHGIKARHKRRHPRLVTAALLAPAVAAFAAVAVAVTVPAVRVLAGVALLPAAAVLGVNLTQVQPRALQRVGWTLVAANAATLVLLVWL